MRVRHVLWVAIAFVVGCGETAVEPEVAPSFALPTPGGVDDLQVTSTGFSTFTIQWTEVDDGTGRPASYRVKYAPPPIDWKTATTATRPSGSTTACKRTISGTTIGATMTCVITGIPERGSTYEVQLASFRIVDGVWRDTKYSNIASGTTLGTAPPLVVTDLTVTNVTATQIELSWTQVDDGTGHPAWYRVKYDAPPIVYKTATVGCDRTIRGTAIGDPMSCAITGLAPETAYEVQLMSYKLVDGVWTNSHFSNIVSATTPPAGLLGVSIADRTDLQPLPGATDAVGVDVNSHGVAVGSSGGRPVVWESGTPRELPVIAGSTATVATSINDAGEIAGYTALSNGNTRAVLWKDGTVTEIGTLPGYTHSRAVHISSAGAIVGRLDGATTSDRVGFYWNDGTMTVLPELAGHTYSFAQASSSAGLIIGVSHDHLNDDAAFVVWESDGNIVWSGGAPVPNGNDAWIGISDASDGFGRNTDVGGLWRWRDGQQAGWPVNQNLGDGLAVSVGGLVVGATMQDWEYVDRGVWNPLGHFYAFDDQSVRCFDISDGYVLCGSQGFGLSWTARLDFQ